MSTMNLSWEDQVIRKSGLKAQQVKATLALFEEGHSLPFVARYRRQVTGDLSELQLRDIYKLMGEEKELARKKEAYLKDFEEKGILKESLRRLVHGASDLSELMEITKPYRETRKTRADKGREAGFGDLADAIWANRGEWPRNFRGKLPRTDEEKDFVRDILAEEIARDERLFPVLENAVAKGEFQSRLKRGAKDEEGLFQDYHEFSMPVFRLKPHQILAVQRGVQQGILSQGFQPLSLDERRLLRTLDIHRPHQVIEEALEDSLKRLMIPSRERLVHQRLLDEARERSMSVFGRNVRSAMLAPPNQAQAVLALDPGYAAGCKGAITDGFGKLLEIFTIFPHQPRNQMQEALKLMQKLCEKHHVDLLVLGNGTASRETRELLETLRKSLKKDLRILTISEAGASVWSATEAAAKEFPDLKPVERGSISIARRALDPLAESVRIPPEALGVGMYQHDLPENRLRERLRQEVESAAAFAGANPNSASEELLTCIPGIGPVLAKRILQTRDETGGFQSRKDLSKVKGLGAKTLEQCIGFLRIPQSREALDQTGVHPQDYALARKILKSCNLKPEDLGEISSMQVLKQANLDSLKIEEGEYQVESVRRLLSSGMRDPRMVFAVDSEPGPRPTELESLRPGTPTWGVIRNIVDFGAFVDMGLKRDGLLHRSKVCKGNQQVEDVLSLGALVHVIVEEVDQRRGRISLSLEKPLQNAGDEQWL